MLQFKCCLTFFLNLFLCRSLILTVFYPFFLSIISFFQFFLSPSSVSLICHHGLIISAPQTLSSLLTFVCALTVPAYSLSKPYHPSPRPGKQAFRQIPMQTLDRSQKKDLLSNSIMYLTVDSLPENTREEPAVLMLNFTSAGLRIVTPICHSVLRPLFEERNVFIFSKMSNRLLISLEFQSSPNSQYCG